MVKITNLKNGDCIGLAVAEIISVPYFELLDANIDKANYANHVFTTHLLSGFHRRAQENNIAFELLFSGVDVNNQTYKAQVKIHLIVRMLGKDETIVERSILDTVQSIRNDFEEHNFTISFFESEKEYTDFDIALENIDTSKVLAVSKIEEAVANTMSLAKCTYYTEVVEPSEIVNTSAISNTLSQYPNSAISMQIIPTVFTREEIISIEETKTFLNYYASNMRYQQSKLCCLTQKRIQRLQNTTIKSPRKRQMMEPICHSALRMFFIH